MATPPPLQTHLVHAFLGGDERAQHGEAHELAGLAIRATVVDAPVLESPVRAADLHRGRLRLRRHGGGRGCRRRRLRSPSKELFDDAEEAGSGLRITNFIYPPEVAEAIEAAREEKAQLARAAVDDVRKREHQPWRFDRRWRSGADRLWAWFCDGERRL